MIENDNSTLTLDQMADQIRQGLQRIYEEKWPGEAIVTTEIVKESIIVHYRENRTKLTRQQALSFLDVLAEASPTAQDGVDLDA